MSTRRQVRRIVKSRPVIEGAGVHLHRAIGFDAPERHDPFLLLDDFRSDRAEEHKVDSSSLPRVCRSDNGAGREGASISLQAGLLYSG